MSNYSFCKEHGYYSKNGDTGCPWCMKRWAALWKKKAKELKAEVNESDECIEMLNSQYWGLVIGLAKKLGLPSMHELGCAVTTTQKLLEELADGYTEKLGRDLGKIRSDQIETYRMNLRWAYERIKSLESENWQVTKEVERLERNLEHRFKEIDYLLKQ